MTLMRVMTPGGGRTVIRCAASVCVALALAACGSSSSSTTQPAVASSSTSTAAITSRTQSAASSTATAAPTSTAPLSSTNSGPPPCRAAGLALRFLGQQGATGHGELGFAVRNTGSATCGTIGYPGVQFLGATGALLPTRTQRTTNDFFGHSPLVPVYLKPGHFASFRLGVTHGIASPAGCTTAHGLQVYPPNDTVTLRVTIPAGASECGTATVSPLRAGTTAYP